jgi:hypothetical protein
MDLGLKNMFVIAEFVITEFDCAYTEKVTLLLFTSDAI